MWRVYILAAIFIAEVYSVPVDDKSYGSYIEECANKLNIDLPKLEKLFKDTHKPTDDFYCLIDCAIEQENKAKGITETHYESLMRTIKEVDKNRDESYTYQQLESKLIECNSKGLHGCEFLKCIKLGEPPFVTFWLYT